MWRQRREVEDLLRRERFLLELVRELLEAARESSDEVIEHLASAIERHEPRIDAILVFVPQGEELACVYAKGARTQFFERLRLRRDADGFLPARAAMSGHRASGVEGFVVPTDRRAVAVPMRDREGLRAVVYASSGDAAALEDEDAIVRAVEHAASPFALACAWESDRADATYDGLTGLMTPRAFRERLRDEVGRLRLRPAPVLTLWFIDTDNFKNVNDTFGHAAGDAVLQTMARLLRVHTVAEVDVAARNGGDEFCAILHDAQKTLSIERAQEFCDDVRRTDFGIPLQITTSVGVAAYPYDAQSASELLEIADAAMYHSKRTGRDRVSFATPDGSFAIYRATSMPQRAGAVAGVPGAAR